MGIEKLNCEVVKHWLENSLYCKLVAKSDGSIVWANRAFCNWIGYLHTELYSKKCSDFSLRGETFEKDLENLEIIQNDYVSSYVIHKRFLKRNGDSEWGIFHVMKCPEINNEKNDYYLCSWHPIKSEDEDFSRKILTKIEKMTEEISEMTKSIIGLTEKVCEPQDEESKWFSYTVKMIKKYPKAAIIFLLVVMGSYGLSNIISILGKLGIITLDTP